MLRNQIPSLAARQRLTLPVRRRYATAAEISSIPKKSVTRRIVSPIIGATALFYGVSVPLGYFSLQYRDFLVESVPLGEYLADGLDKVELYRNGVSEADAAAAASIKSKGTKETEWTRYAESKAKAEGWALKQGDKPDPSLALKESKLASAAKSAAASAEKAKEKVEEKVEAKAQAVQAKVEETVTKIETKVAEAVPEVIKKVDPPSNLPVWAQRPRELDATPLPPVIVVKELYSEPLPVDFEPPPGYEIKRAPSAPQGRIQPVPPTPEPLPLVAPTISDLAAAEPVFGQLASTIDSLAKYISNNTQEVSTSASGVLKDAQLDLKALATRLDSIKEVEKANLESSLQAQAAEYTTQLRAAEEELVNRLSLQETDYRKAFEEEHLKLSNAYKEKLDQELHTQQEIINQRLKEEVIAQGIELQRRWVQELNVRVEEERGGRLAKLAELEGGLRQLEKVTRENEESMTEAVRSQRIFATIKALSRKASSGLPFAEELDILQKLAKSTESEDSLLSLAAGSISSAAASSGVTSFPALATRFSISLAPKLQTVALFPENGGIVDYVVSYLSSFLLLRQEGWAEGDDVNAVVARAGFHIANKDLDLATREITTLTGWPKALASDWVNQARKHLEVQQALQVLESEATASNLKSL